MIIVRISGGIGNQLFQIGFAKMLSEKYLHNVKIDLSFYSDQKSFLYKRYLTFNKVPTRNFEFFSNPPFEFCNFDDLCYVFLHASKNTSCKSYKSKKLFLQFIINVISTSFFLKLFSKKVITEKNIDLNNLNCDNLIYSGYWQSSIYFSGYEDILKKYVQNLLSIKNIFNFNSQFNLNDYIVLHVRKGDYLKINTYFELDKVYYINSINYIKEINPNLKKILIITNDHNWCLNNFNFSDYKVEFTDAHMSFYYDFSIMNQAKYIVTSNSTFCFWAVFIGQPFIATMPTFWYNNSKFGYIPKGWQIINCI